MVLLVNLKSFAVIALSFLLFGCSSGQTETKQNVYSEQDTAYVNGKLFDPMNGFENKTIVVREGIVFAKIDALSDEFPRKSHRFAG